MTFIRCPENKKQYPITRCVACPRFPCKRVGKAELSEIMASDRVVRQASFKERRVTMYIFRKKGTLIEAPASFDPDDPDLEMLEDVDEVLVISKVLVKQVRLVVKPKEAAASEPEQKRAKKR